MFPSPQILDRGRLLLALLLVAPLAPLVPVPGMSGDRQGPQWAAVVNGENPIAAEADPADVLANLTNPTVAPGDPNAGPQPSSSNEVGSDADVAVPDGQPAAAAPGKLPVANTAITGFPAPPGATHVFPVAGGAKYTNDWGGERPGGRTHEGIDLFAIAGSPVVAVSDGTLFKVGWHATGGWRFWLRDRWGNTFYYAHLSAFTAQAKEGARVAAGSVIGFVGNTGDADPAAGSVLHFEIHPNGAGAIPPFPYVAKWPRL